MLLYKVGQKMASKSYIATLTMHFIWQVIRVHDGSCKIALLPKSLGKLLGEFVARKRPAFFIGQNQYKPAHIVITRKQRLEGWQEYLARFIIRWNYYSTVRLAGLKKMPWISD